MVVPTPTAFINPVTVPASPGPNSVKVSVVTWLVVFLTYEVVPVWSGAAPPVLFTGVNPAQRKCSVSFVRSTATPAIVSGGSGTNFPNIKFNSFIESFVWSELFIVNAPDLNPPAGVPITWLPVYVVAVTVPTYSIEPPPYVSSQGLSNATVSAIPTPLVSLSAYIFHHKY